MQRISDSDAGSKAIINGAEESDTAIGSISVYPIHFMNKSASPSSSSFCALSSSVLTNLDALATISRRSSRVGDTYYQFVLYVSHHVNDELKFFFKLK